MTPPVNTAAFNRIIPHGRSTQPGGRSSALDLGRAESRRLKIQRIENATPPLFGAEYLEN
jgi:hypothetical protein